MKEFESLKRGCDLATRIIELKNDVVSYLNTEKGSTGPIMVLHAFKDLSESIMEVTERQIKEEIAKDPDGFNRFCKSKDIPDEIRNKMLRDIEASKKNPAGTAEAEEVNIEPIN